MSLTDAYVFDAVRTPFGKVGGALSGVRPDDMAAHVVRTLVDRAPGLEGLRAASAQAVADAAAGHGGAPATSQAAWAAQAEAPVAVSAQPYASPSSASPAANAGGSPSARYARRYGYGDTRASRWRG